MQTNSLDQIITEEKALISRSGSRRAVEKIYMVTHRYDLKNLIVCLASIKYWYPHIRVVVIKNENNGKFNFDFLKKDFNVSFAEETNYIFGKFYGSFEPFLSGRDERFIIVDTDIAFTGRIIDLLESRNEDFVVDYEVQPLKKIKQLYWDPNGIGNYVASYSENWFTFNNGIMLGKGDKIRTSDMADFMVWEKSKVPAMMNDLIFPAFDMSAINVVVNKKYFGNEITVCREEIMIYPPNYKESEAALLYGIKERNGKEYRIIHWADQKYLKGCEKPLHRIFDFYKHFFFTQTSKWNGIRIKLYMAYLKLEFNVRNNFKLKVNSMKTDLYKNS